MNKIINYIKSFFKGKLDNHSNSQLLTETMLDKYRLSSLDERLEGQSPQEIERICREYSDKEAELMLNNMGVKTRPIKPIDK